MKKYILIFFLTLIIPSVAVCQTVITGRVVSKADNLPLPGATVRIKGERSGLSADSLGRFSITLAPNSSVIQVSFLGFKTKELALLPGQTGPILIALEPGDSLLDEVTVSTGYQVIPKERATGAFARVGNELFNRNPGPGILNRLDDAVPGLVFNQKGSSPISIRGLSTIYANASPLIILDNFPYEGNLDLINPADIESVTVLRDAAAASIWGARAGNGVIVITTKKGMKDQRPVISINSNFTAGDKPDLFYLPQMNSADFIEMEKTLFGRGYYRSMETSTNKNNPFTPVVELLIAKRDGLIDPATADAQIESLKNFDLRNDLHHHAYRNSFIQQHSMNLTGGGEFNKFYVSAGYIENRSSSIGNGSKQITFNGSNTFSLLKDKVELTAGVYFSSRNSAQNNPGTLQFKSGQALYPYARLVDDSGNPVTLTQDYRPAFIRSAEQAGLLNWEYNYLRELDYRDNRTVTTDYRINAGAKVELLKGLAADLKYQHSGTGTNGRDLLSHKSYYVRNLINRMSVVNSDGTVTRNIPLGDILDLDNASVKGRNFRAQLNFNRVWGNDHSLNAIGGWEVQTMDNVRNSHRVYGYNDEFANSQVVDYVTQIPLYYNPGSKTSIPNGDSQRETADRFRSFFFNSAYTFRQKYTLSVSARKDESNLFGVRANQKGVPLWSAGLKWNLDQENFYKLNWLPELKVRATYGRSGNVDRTVTAYTTALVSPNITPVFRLPFALIMNPPNPDLRWEKIHMYNLGLDFALAGNVVRGSIDVFRKRGEDLIGFSSYPPSTGITEFKGNTASMVVTGMDAMLSSSNLRRGLRWETDLIVSYAKDRVLNYEVPNTTTSLVQSADGARYPVSDRPLYSVYSYPWAGLDPATGDPRSYLNGVASNNYNTILSTITPEDLVFHGRSTPLLSGSLRNSFAWKGLSLSATIGYRLGFYFRRRSVSYNSILTAQGGHGDYSLRWQKPGEELITNVPSLPAASNTNRDNIYTYSSALIEKGDHLRLKDIRLGYDLRKTGLNLPFRSGEVYIYANNFGMIWKAGESSVDPDFQAGPPPRTIAAGLRVSL